MVSWPAARTWKCPSGYCQCAKPDTPWIFLHCAPNFFEVWPSKEISMIHMAYRTSRCTSPKRPILLEQEVIDLFPWYNLAFHSLVWISSKLGCIAPLVDSLCWCFCDCLTRRAYSLSRLSASKLWVIGVGSALVCALQQDECGRMTF